MSAGANCNQKGPFGVTPLMLAANSEMTEMVSLLLLNGADPLVQNDDGETALSIAKRKNLHDVINLLAPPKKAPPQPAAPVAMAAQPLPSDEEAHSSSSDEPAQAPSKPAVRKTVLNLAPQDIELLQMVKQGLTETAANLIEAGANPNVRTDDGISPLIIAVSRNDLTTAEMLLLHREATSGRVRYDSADDCAERKSPMIRLLCSGRQPAKKHRWSKRVTWV
jgi:ankyrin repeat protein